MSHLNPPLPSPYNFVPLPAEVHLPSWSKQVSMDVPFSDGISGWFDVEVEAKTPIYVRNGGVQPETAEDKEKASKRGQWQDFFQVTPNGRYAIPGTSLKGVIRSVVEIITFGKMNPDFVNNARYSVRDLDLPAYKALMTGKSKPGWLVVDNNSGKGCWKIVKANLARVEHSDLAALHKKNKLHAIDLNEAGIKAQTKYDRWQLPLDVFFRSAEVEPQPRQNRNHRRAILAKGLSCSPLEGGTQGTLVFTGQPNEKKHLEFLFFPTATKAITMVSDAYVVPEGVRDDFLFVHSLENSKGEGDSWDWGIWSQQLESGKPVPVFYLEENNEIKAVGLAQMFRLPYQKTVHQCLESNASTEEEGHFASEMDFAQAMFGSVGKKGNLRGRVNFETLLAPEGATVAGTQATILGSPKSTFYPSYIEQLPLGGSWNARGEVIRTEARGPRNLPSPVFATLMDTKNNVNLRGYKRYPVRADQENGTWRGGAPKHPAVSEGQNEVATWFRPLPAGTVFTGRVHVHNLKPEELGALYWALTWGGEEKLRHSVGMAKPYGYGSVQIRLKEKDSDASLDQPDGSSHEKFTPQVLMQLFSSYMKDVEKDWLVSSTMKELMAMADPTQIAEERMLRYPVLNPDENINDFREAKQREYGVALLPYSLFPKAATQFKPASNPPPRPQSAPAASTPVYRLREQQQGRAVRQGTPVTAVVVGHAKSSGNPKVQIKDSDPPEAGFLSGTALKKLGKTLPVGKELRLLRMGGQSPNIEFDAAE